MAAIWSVITLEHANDRVTAIHWKVTDDNGTYIGEVESVFEIPSGHAAENIPYQNVTEQQCIAWVKADLGGAVSKYEREAAKRRQEQITPRDGYVRTNRGVPW